MVEFSEGGLQQGFEAGGLRVGNFAVIVETEAALVFIVGRVW